LAFLATTIPALNRMLDTVLLDGQHWRVCLLVVIAYIALAELGKVLLRRVRPDELG
jgi:hypothetical protein